MIVPLVSRRAYDYSAASGAATDLVLARYVDVTTYRSAVLLCRVHEVNIVVGGTLNVMVFRTSPSPDAPDDDFVQTTSIATAAIHSAAKNTLVRKTLSTWFGSHVRVILRADPAASPASLTATLSIALVLNEQP